MASESDVAVASFDALPPTLLRVIFLALPVEARAQAACVCRAWRAFLADVSLWLVLDLTYDSGVALESATENLVRAAAARAGGRLRVLKLDYSVTAFGVDLPQLVVDVAKSNAAELQVVRIDDVLSIEDVEAVLAAAPRLQVLGAGVSGPSTALLPLLRNDPPYGALRIGGLDADFDAGDNGAAAEHVLAFAAAVAAHESLTSLAFADVHLARGVNALVDAAAERSVNELRMISCALDAETVPALVRLLQRGLLESLEVSCEDFPDEPEESLPELCAAIRACPKLLKLRICLNPPEGATHRAFAELLDAAAALPELDELDLRDSVVQDGDGAAVGRALGAFLGANLPALRTLHVSQCRFGDECLGPLLDGLAANTCLRWLECRDNDPSPAFMHYRLVPAMARMEARLHLVAQRVQDGWLD